MARGTAATDVMAVGGEKLGGLLGGDALGNDELIGGQQERRIAAAAEWKTGAQRRS